MLLPALISSLGRARRVRLDDHYSKTRIGDSAMLAVAEPVPLLVGFARA